MKTNIKFLHKLFLLLFLALYFIPASAIEGKLVVSTFPNFFDRWYKNLNGVPLASIPQTQHVYKRQVFYVLPLISGFGMDAKKKSNVTYRLTISRNGKVVLDRKNVRGLMKEVNDSSAVFLCETVQNYEFGDEAEEGVYDIEVIITDNISGKSTTVKETVSVSRYQYRPRPYTMLDSFLVWQNYYYEGNEPDREMDGLVFFSHPQMQQDAEKVLPYLGFFAELFKGKTYLLRELDSLFTTRNNNERLTMIQVLHLADYMPKSLQKKFTADEKKYYDELKGHGLPIIPDSTVKNPFLLNLLWAKFFATGDYAYAKKIAQTMELAIYEGALGRYTDSEKTDKDQQEAFWETVYQKNVQDMLQRLPNHILFNGYCLYMIAAKDVSPTVIKELERVVVR